MAWRRRPALLPRRVHWHVLPSGHRLARQRLRAPQRAWRVHARPLCRVVDHEPERAVLRRRQLQWVMGEQQHLPLGLRRRHPVGMSALYACAASVGMAGNGDKHEGWTLALAPVCILAWIIAEVLCGTMSSVLFPRSWLALHGLCCHANPRLKLLAFPYTCLLQGGSDPPPPPTTTPPTPTTTSTPTDTGTGGGGGNSGACDSDPCYMGTCEDLGDGYYQCNCFSGWTGGVLACLLITSACCLVLFAAMCMRAPRRADFCAHLFCALDHEARLQDPEHARSICIASRSPCLL